MYWLGIVDCGFLFLFYWFWLWWLLIVILGYQLCRQRCFLWWSCLLRTLTLCEFLILFVYFIYLLGEFFVYWLIKFALKISKVWLSICICNHWCLKKKKNWLSDINLIKYFRIFHCPINWSSWSLVSFCSRCWVLLLRVNSIRT